MKKIITVLPTIIHKNNETLEGQILPESSISYVYGNG